MKPPPEEPIDRNPNGLVCMDIFTVTGTLTVANPLRPIDPETNMPETGCWPVGTWNFTAARDPSNENTSDISDPPDGIGERCGLNVPGTQPAVFDASYTFVVARVDDPEIGYIDTVSFTGAQNRVLRLKYTSGGGGECEGGFELISADRREVWNWKPALTGTVIDGYGEYTKFIDPLP